MEKQDWNRGNLPESHIKQVGFDHEKLTVYQRSIEFVVWTEKLLGEISRSVAVYRQLDRAATSIPLNIAEGNGKYQAADRCRFFDIARGSAFESAACLDVLLAKGIVVNERAHEGKEILIEIVSMMVGLIRANSNERQI